MNKNKNKTAKTNLAAKAKTAKINPSEKTKPEEKNNPTNVENPTKEDVEKIAAEATQEATSQQNKNPEPPKATSKPKSKPEEKPDPKQDKKPKPKIEPETIIPETVEHQEPAVTSPAYNSPELKGFKQSVLQKLANGDRIDANSGIKLMSMLKERWVDNGNTDLQIKELMSQQFDIMALTSILHWNIQTTQELGECGLQVNESAFDQISEGLALYFNITVKKLPKTSDGQLQLQFEPSPEVKKEVETTNKIQKESKNKPLPVYSTGKSEEDIVKDLEIILTANNGMSSNFENAITYARKAFNLEKDSPAKVLCKILDELGKYKRINILLNGLGRMSFGAITKNSIPFMGSVLLKKHFPNYTDEQLTELSQVLFSLGAQLNINAMNKCGGKQINAVDYLIPWNSLFKSVTDKILNDIVGTLSDETASVKIPKVKGILSEEEYDCKKIMNHVKSSYGSNLNAKQLKQQMSKLLALFQKSEVSPLDKYVEHGYGLTEETK